MPLGDAASGCVELLGRVLVEIVVHGLGELIWPWLKVSGGFVVWVLTFGRVNLTERHEHLAGWAGLIVHTVAIALLIWWITAAPDPAR